MRDALVDRVPQRVDERVGAGGGPPVLREPQQARPHTQLHRRGVLNRYMYTKHMNIYVYLHNLLFLSVKRLLHINLQSAFMHICMNVQGVEEKLCFFHKSP